MDPAVVPAPGVWSEAIGRALQHGDPAGSVWRPGETDTSIRPGWFHPPAEAGKGKSVAALTEIYFNSVGRNSKLLLTVPPTRDGVLHDGDVARLAPSHDRLAALFAEDFAAGRHPTEPTTSPRTAAVEVDLGRSVMAGLVRLEEDIAHGQRVARYAVVGAGESGAWSELVRGETIGYRKLDRFAPASVRRVRVVVEDAVAAPRRSRSGCTRASDSRQTRKRCATGIPLPAARSWTGSSGGSANRGSAASRGRTRTSAGKGALPSR